MSNLAAKIIFASTALLGVWGCEPSRSKGDIELLRALEEKYGTTISFQLSDSTYLEASSKTETSIDDKTAKNILTDFSGTHGGSGSTGTFVYLNLYNRSGTFERQLYWDEQTNSYIWSLQDHY